MSVLSMIDYRNFRHSLALWILERYPEKIWRLSQEELHSKLDQIIQDARSFRLQTEKNVAWLADFIFQLGEVFYNNDQYEWAIDILLNLHLDEDEKIDQLRGYIYPKVDEE